MKNLALSAALAAAVLMMLGPAFAQGTRAQNDCNQPSAAAKGSAQRAPGTKAPEKIEGEVTKVDPKTGAPDVNSRPGWLRNES